MENNIMVKKLEKVWAYKLKHPEATVRETAEATGTSRGYVRKLFNKIGTPKEIIVGDRDLVSRGVILDKAKTLTTVDRRKEHGDALDNFETTAAYWNTHLGINQITPHDVAIMMSMLKMARMRQKDDNIDNYVDICGYMALGGEISQKCD